MTMYNNYDYTHIVNGQKIGYKECGIYDNNGLAIGYKMQTFDANSGQKLSEKEYLFETFRKIIE